MTFRTRGWERVPALAGELCPNLLVRTGPITTPGWALVSTVLHWPSDSLHLSHPAFGTSYGERVENLRKALPATFVLIEFVQERLGVVVRDDLTVDDSEVGSFVRWMALPKTCDVTVLGRPTGYGDWEVGVWPEPLDSREGDDGGDEAGEMP